MKESDIKNEALSSMKKVYNDITMSLQRFVNSILIYFIAFHILFPGSGWFSNMVCAFLLLYVVRFVGAIVFMRWTKKLTDKIKNLNS